MKVRSKVESDVDREVAMPRDVIGGLAAALRGWIGAGDRADVANRHRCRFQAYFQSLLPSSFLSRADERQR